METNNTNKQPELERIADALESIALSLEVRTLKRMPSAGFTTTTYYNALKYWSPLLKAALRDNPDDEGPPSP